MKSITYIASALSGFTVWIGVGVIIGNPEAWDSALYWKVGIPLLAFVTFIIGFFEPKTPHIWGIIQALSQWIAILLEGLYLGFSLNLWPPSIIAFVLLAVPSVISAYLGVVLANIIKKRRTAKGI